MPKHGIQKATTKPEFKIPPQELLLDYDKASYSHKVIMDKIKKFEDSLDDDHEVAIRLVSFGENIVLSVTNVGYTNPNIMIFSGYVGDQPATLIQNISQLNFLLLSVRRTTNVPKPKIGFIWE